MKKKLVILSIIVIISSVLQRFLLSSYQISESLLGNIITFLSILFGFYITSLAIFVTSSFVRKLYRITDKDDKTTTLLHTLLKNYKFGLIIALITISYLLLILLFAGSFIFDENLSLKLWFTYLIIPSLVVNIGYGYLMLSDLINIVIQEAKTLDS